MKAIFKEPTEIPCILSENYFRSLNGFRAIAILIVLISHFHLSDSYFYTLLFNGNLGVLIFFVLSGFLITTLCLKEKITTQTINLKNFYIRRILRIFPVAYLFLFVIIILNYIYNLNISFVAILAAAFYVVNISSLFRAHYYTWYTGHYWSLSVEEQFYLIFPFILNWKFSLFYFMVIFIAAFLPVIVLFQEYYPPLNSGFLYAFTHYFIKFQPISIGCLLAIWFFKFPNKILKLRKFGLYINLIFPIIIFYLRYDNFFKLENIISGLIASLLVGCIVIINIFPSNNYFYKLLNSKVLNVIGLCSYSIYIWQQIFTSSDGKLPNIITAFPINIFFIALISLVSYYFFESYFLKFKTKFISKN